MAYLSEAAVERVVLDDLTNLGYSISSDAEIGPDGKVVAEDLSGDGIRAAVASALGAPQPEAETPATQPGVPGTQPSTTP